MSLYVSSKAGAKSLPLVPTTAPVLLKRINMSIKHRIYSPYYKFHHIVIDSYEIYNSKNKEISYPIWPDGCMQLQFIFSPLGSVAQVWGCQTQKRELLIPARGRLYALRLHPGAWQGLQRNYADEITDKQIPFNAYFKQSQRLGQKLRFSESFHERNIIFQHFFSFLGIENFRGLEKLSYALKEIQQAKGNIRVQDIAKILGCSTRYVSRIFVQQVGISPKIYAQLVQLQISGKMILHNRPKSLLDVAVSCGYFDQAHMNRAYQKYLFCTAYDVKNDSSKDISGIELLTDNEVIRQSQIYRDSFVSN